MTLPQISATRRMLPLGELCQVDRCAVSPSAPEFPDLPYIGLEHIEAQTGRILQPLGGGMKSTGFRFDNRHILYGRLRPYLNKVAIPDFSGRCTSEIIPLLPRKGESRNFLACALRQPAVVDFAVHNSTGSRMPRINIERLLEFPVYVPDIAAERKQLGNTLLANLRRAAKMQTAMQEQAEALAALPASILSGVFTHKSRVQLGEMAKIRMGETLIKKNLTGKGTPVFSADESNRPWGMTDNARLSFEENTIVIGARGTIGSVKLPMLPSFTCTQTTIAVSVNKNVLPAFAAYFLKSFSFKAITEGSGIPMITVANVAKILIPVPPLSEQRIITRMLKAKMKTAVKLNAAAKAQLNAVESLPGAWLRRAFSEQ